MRTPNLFLLRDVKVFWIPEEVRPSEKFNCDHTTFYIQAQLDFVSTSSDNTSWTKKNPPLSEWTWFFGGFT
jgi:hypothetical protein